MDANVGGPQCSRMRALGSPPKSPTLTAQELATTIETIMSLLQSRNGGTLNAINQQDTLKKEMKKLF